MRSVSCIREYMNVLCVGIWYPWTPDISLQLVPLCCEIQISILCVGIWYPWTPDIPVNSSHCAVKSKYPRIHRHMKSTSLQVISSEIHFNIIIWFSERYIYKLFTKILWPALFTLNSSFWQCMQMCNTHLHSLLCIYITWCLNSEAMRTRLLHGPKQLTALRPIVSWWMMNQPSVQCEYIRM